MEKMAWDGPTWGQEDFFPTNPDLADILGRTDLNFETFILWIFCTPHFWISRRLWRSFHIAAHSILFIAAHLAEGVPIVSQFAP